MFGPDVFFQRGNKMTDKVATQWETKEETEFETQ